MLATPTDRRGPARPQPNDRFHGASRLLESSSRNCESPLKGYASDKWGVPMLMLKLPPRCNALSCGRVARSSVCTELAKVIIVEPENIIEHELQSNGVFMPARVVRVGVRKHNCVLYAVDHYPEPVSKILRSKHLAADVEGRDAQVIGSHSDVDIPARVTERLMDPLATCVRPRCDGR